LILALAASVLLLAGNLLFHPIPLYGTETDLVGEYIPAGQELARGVLHAERFSTKGPGYPLLLALAAPVSGGDWFLAARLLNSVAAGVVVWVTFAFFAGLGGQIALAVSLGLLVTPAFLMAGFEAGTDLPALALAMGSACLGFSATARHRYFAAGLLAGLAILTRSNYIAVPIAGLFIIMVRREWFRAGKYLAGMLLPLLSWVGVHLAATGQFPRDSNYLNLAHAVYGTRQSWEDFLTTAAPRFGSYADVLRLDPMRVLMAVVFNLTTRWWMDATRLLVLPLGILGIIGIAWFWRRHGAWPVLAAHALSAYMVLCFTFYAPRFNLYLIPFYLSGVALALLPTLPRVPSVASEIVKRNSVSRGLVAIVALYAVSATVSLSHIRSTLSHTAYATYEVGKALRLIGDPQAAVMARKPHVAYYAGLHYLPMPRTAGLTDLIVEAYRRQAQFVFMSQAEANLRPEFTVLTDSGVSLPGLRQVAYRRDRGGSAAAYAVSAPLPDGRQQHREVAASLERGVSSLSRERRIAIATELLGAGEYALALRQLFTADSIGPPDADIAALESNAFHALRMYEPAARACLRSIELGGGTAAHYDQLGRIRFQQGRYGEAAQAFRRALDIAPGVAAPRYLLGLAEYRRGRFDAASEAFQAFLVSQPGSAEARRLAAVSLVRSGRVDEAVRIVEEDPAGIGSLMRAQSFADSLRKGELPE